MTNSTDLLSGYDGPTGEDLVALPENGQELRLCRDHEVFVSISSNELIKIIPYPPNAKHVDQLFQVQPHTGRGFVRAAGL